MENVHNLTSKMLRIHHNLIGIHCSYYLAIWKLTDVLHGYICVLHQFIHGYICVLHQFLKTASTCRTKLIIFIAAVSQHVVSILHYSSSRLQEAVQKHVLTYQWWPT